MCSSEKVTFSNEKEAHTMSWFQVSEDYKVSSCGEKEFPEIGWAPIIDDNGAWGWLYLDPGEPYVFFPPMVIPSFSPKVCKRYGTVPVTLLTPQRDEVVREGKVLYKSVLWEDADKWSPILLRKNLSFQEVFHAQHGALQVNNGLYSALPLEVLENNLQRLLSTEKY